MKKIPISALIIMGLYLSGCNLSIPSPSSAYPDVEPTQAIDDRAIQEPQEPEQQTPPKQAPSNLDQDNPLLDQLTLPEGFEIGIYAEVPNARSLGVVETDTRIIVFVGNRKQDKVYALVDADKDGSNDEIIVIATGLNSPNGVAYKDGDLYVAEINKILKFSNILDTLDDPSYEVFFDDLPDDASHGWKYIAFGPDGNLYIPVGAPCNNCDAGLPYAAIHKLDMQTKKLSLVAQGVRNTVGFDRHPTTNDLRFTDNGRDWFGNDIPPDELNNITKDQQHFGYPFCHGGDLPDDEFTRRACAEFTPPIAKLGPHVAALGMVFSDTLAVSSEWKNHILIAEHGSWNRKPPIGYRISAVDLETNEYKIFIDGWLQSDDVLGRPVDIAGLPDGSFLISDDGAGLLYKVIFE